MTPLTWMKRANAIKVRHDSKTKREKRKKKKKKRKSELQAWKGKKSAEGSTRLKA